MRRTYQLTFRYMSPSKTIVESFSDDEDTDVVAKLIKLHATTLPEGVRDVVCDVRIIGDGADDYNKLGKSVVAARRTLGKRRARRLGSDEREGFPFHVPPTLAAEEPEPLDPKESGADPAVPAGSSLAGDILFWRIEVPDSYNSFSTVARPPEVAMSPAKLRPVPTPDEEDDLDDAPGDTHDGQLRCTVCGWIDNTETGKDKCPNCGGDDWEEQ